MKSDFFLTALRSLNTKQVVCQHLDSPLELSVHSVGTLHQKMDIIMDNKLCSIILGNN